MSARDEYTFHIDAYSPETMPMARLAEYMADLAALLGHTSQVHFVKLEGGTTAIVHAIEHEAVPKVSARLLMVKDPEASDDVRNPYLSLNERLREDNATGRLLPSTGKVIEFPGRELPRPQKFGPFKQAGQIDGVLVRIGGKDKTIHATLQDQEGRALRCIVTRELAKEMAHHFLGDPLRLTGTGRWERNATGEWTLLAFKASHFLPLKDEGLSTVVLRLRNIKSEVARVDDPLRLLKHIRGEDDETH